MKPRDCLTPVLIAAVIGAGLATLLCAILINGRARRVEEIERTERLSAPFTGTFHVAPGAGMCGQFDGGGTVHRIECPKVQP